MGSLQGHHPWSLSRSCLVQSKPLDLPKTFHIMVDIGHHVIDIMGIQDSRMKSDKNGGYVTH
jgi:hypothetical protein